MKRLLTFSAAGLVAMALPALAMAQTTPQTMPQNPPPQTMPQNRPQQTMPQQMQQRMQQRQMQQRNAPAAAAAQQEIATAHAHALMAQGAQSVKMAHTHLHHVINCLEGTTGTDFDGQAGNPCKGKGRGALLDAQANPSTQSRLHQALSAAQAGLKASELNAVHADASKVASLLQAPPSTGGTMK